MKKQKNGTQVLRRRIRHRREHGVQPKNTDKNKRKLLKLDKNQSHRKRDHKDGRPELIGDAMTLRMVGET